MGEQLMELNGLHYEFNNNKKKNKKNKKITENSALRWVCMTHFPGRMILAYSVLC